MNEGETRAALALIAAPSALSAEVEGELEERGLIVTDHRPFARLTDSGRAFLRYGSCPTCGENHYGPCEGVRT